jgi:hypothetical protein
MEKESNDEWDIFVSYTKDDLEWAEWISWQLEEARWRTLFQAWDIVPGKNWVHSMHEGVQRATRTLAVLSPAYLRSMYGTAEWEAAWAADPLGRRRKLLPVRVAECDRPGLLGQVVGVDLFRCEPAEARRRLLDAVQASIAGRMPPTSPPPFPGGKR